MSCLLYFAVSFPTSCIPNLSSFYRAEGICIDDIVFVDNVDILELIQGKEGLMSKLDQVYRTFRLFDRMCGHEKLVLVVVVVITQTLVI